MRRYDMDYKLEAVKLAKEIGSTRASKQLDIPQGTLDNWLAKDKRGELEGGANGTRLTPKAALSLADENKKLKQEVKELKQVNEILRKASAFFVQSQKR
jgi:transposase